MSKLIFYKYAYFLLFLSLSTFFINHFHSYTKILSLVPLNLTPNFLHSHFYSPHFYLGFPHSLHFCDSVLQFLISVFIDYREEYISKGTFKVLILITIDYSKKCQIFLKISWLCCFKKTQGE